ncbi:MAG: hypothetical protein R2747_13525 [Pyrinomonadaceae bacterium]
MSSRGKKDERAQLKREADAATREWQPTALEQLQEQNTLTFLKDWDSGKDVKDIEGLRPYLNLYQNAAASQDAEKLGGGVFNLSGEGAGKMAEKMRSQNALRKEQAASGQLYDSANQAYSYASGVLTPSLIQTQEARNSGKASLANQRYQAFLNQPQSPNPWLQALGIGAGVAGMFAPTPKIKLTSI